MTKKEAARKFGQLARKIREEAREDGALMSPEEIQNVIDQVRREKKGKVSARSNPRRGR